MLSHVRIPRQKYYYYYYYYYKFCCQIEVPEHSNCRLVLYWREFLYLKSASLELCFHLIYYCPCTLRLTLQGWASEGGAAYQAAWCPARERNILCTAVVSNLSKMLCGPLLKKFRLRPILFPFPVPSLFLLCLFLPIFYPLFLCSPLWTARGSQGAL